MPLRIINNDKYHIFWMNLNGPEWSLRFIWRTVRCLERSWYTPHLLCNYKPITYLHSKLVQKLKQLNMTNNALWPIYAAWAVSHQFFILWRREIIIRVSGDVWYLKVWWSTTCSANHICNICTVWRL